MAVLPFLVTTLVLVTVLVLVFASMTMTMTMVAVPMSVPMPVSVSVSVPMAKSVPMPVSVPMAMAPRPSTGWRAASTWAIGLRRAGWGWDGARGIVRVPSWHRLLGMVRVGRILVSYSSTRERKELYLQ